MNSRREKVITCGIVSEVASVREKNASSDASLGIRERVGWYS